MSVYLIILIWKEGSRLALGLGKDSKVLCKCNPLQQTGIGLLYLRMKRPGFRENQATASYQQLNEVKGTCKAFMLTLDFRGRKPFFPLSFLLSADEIPLKLASMLLAVLASCRQFLTSHSLIFRLVYFAFRCFCEQKQ
jgi:hypothetical protein